MFKRAIAFETRKWDAVTVIDVLSKYSYKHGLSDLSVTVDNPSRPYIYAVTMSCKEKDLAHVLDDIMRMNRKGVYVSKLYVA